MSDWLHCNSCYKQPGDGTAYFLTQCGHLYCERCKDKGWKQKCLLCGSLNPTALKLTSKLKPPVDAFMSDTYVVIKKICTDLKQVLQTLDFQNNHRRRYIMHLNELKSNQKAAVDKYQKGLQSDLHAKMKSYMQSMEREVSKLRNENSYLKRILQECKESGYKSVLFDLELVTNPIFPISPVMDTYNKVHNHVVTTPTTMAERVESAPTPKSPSGDRGRSSSSPTHKSNNSPSMQLPLNAHDRNIHACIQQSPSDIQNSRVTIRTPPFGGKLGPITVTTPPSYEFDQQMPKSVPHPIALDYNMETPPR